MTRELRYASSEFEVRAADQGAVIVGHAAVFGRLSRDLGGFVETIDGAAFNKTLADNPDVRALINHDPSHLLGRTRSGTLRLTVDDVGLHYEVDVPERSDARDLLISMERGDINQSSFGFYVKGDEWGKTDSGYPLRTLTGISLHEGDVSPVTFPAYVDTDSGVADRAFASLAELRGIDLSTVRQFASEGHLVDVIDGEVEQRETHFPDPANVARHAHAVASLAAIRRR